MRLVTGQSLFDEWRKLVPGSKVCEPRDDMYLRPSKAWASAFNSWCAASVPTWEEEGNDCDDRAEWVMEQARKSQAKGPGNKGFGRAIGIIRILVPIGSTFLNLPEPDKNRRHETNIIATDEAGWFIMDAGVVGLFSVSEASDNMLCLVESLERL